jgi:hypothetical protein
MVVKHVARTRLANCRNLLERVTNEFRKPAAMIEVADPAGQPDLC